MIKRGYLFVYVKGVKRDREESSKSKSPSKSLDVLTNREGTSSRDKEESKGKCQYIDAINRGTPRENILKKEGACQLRP